MRQGMTMMVGATTMRRVPPRLLRLTLVLLPLFAALASLQWVPSASAAGTIIYVKPGGAGTSSGTSWDNAADLSPALIAGAPAGSQIWVAAGTYKPTTNGDRSASFALKKDVAIYGGFAGTETDLSQRDLAANITVLSGDIGVVGDYFDNSYHVVTATIGFGGESALLDGVTVTGGNANGTGQQMNGGGVLITSGTITLTNITITGNRAYSAGGGVYSSYPNKLTLDHAVVRENTGGGLYILGNTTITDTLIEHNTSTTSDGGMAVYYAVTVVMDGVTVRDNHADYYGGSLHIEASGTTTLTNLNVSGNSSGRGLVGMSLAGGTAILSNSAISGNHEPGLVMSIGTFTLTNVTVTGNEGQDYGGVHVGDSASTTLRNSIVWGNSGGELSKTADGRVSVSNSIVKGGWTGAIDADPMFVTSVPPAPSTLGDLRLRVGSPAVDTGDSSVVSPALPATDLGGGPRVIGSSVDMGAYEGAFPAPPIVASIKRSGDYYTHASSADYIVEFDLPVSGVMAHDFALATTGAVSGATVTNVAPVGGTAPAQIWTVTVSTGSGQGTIRLDLIDDDGITTATPPSSSMPLGGVGPGNGNFTTGESYSAGTYLGFLPMVVRE